MELMPLPLGACNDGTAETVKPAVSIVAPPEWTNTPSRLLPSIVAVLLKALKMPLLKFTQANGLAVPPYTLVISMMPPPLNVSVPEERALLALARFN